MVQGAAHQLDLPFSTFCFLSLEALQECLNALGEENNVVEGCAHLVAHHRCEFTRLFHALILLLESFVFNFIADCLCLISDKDRVTRNASVGLFLHLDGYEKIEVFNLGRVQRDRPLG